MGEADYGHDAHMAQYKAWLRRGADVHGALTQSTSLQIDELQKWLDGGSEDRDDRHPQLMLAIHSVELGIHTLGITVALGALAIVGSLGEKIPEPPPLPRPGESVPQ